MQDIFVYGTLLNDEILSLLFGSALSRSSAQLPGYKRVKVLGQAFPAIRPDDQSSVAGAVIAGLNAGDLARLDDYEGRYYTRVGVLVYLEGQVPRHCQTYVFKRRYYSFLSGEDWCNDRFRERDLHQYLAGLLDD